MNSEEEAPLAGLRVIELSTFVAAPLGGMTLAQLGAEVIRIDPPGGNLDSDRWPLGPDGVSLFWNSLNRGKKSLTLDLRKPEAQQIVVDLIAAPGEGGGILMTNMPQRPWNSFEMLAARRPDLIRIALGGNYDGSSAVDYTINCAGGFANVTGTGERPVNHVLPAWDVAAGLHLSTALLAAERRRSRTGKGQSVNIALSDVMISVIGSLGYFADIQVNGDTRGALGNDLYGGFGRDFPTLDGGSVMVVALTPGQWASLARTTGIVLDQVPDAPTGGDLFRNRDAIAAKLGPWIAARPLAQVAETFNTNRVLWGPYQDFATFFRDDPRTSDLNPMMGRIDQPGIGQLRMPGSPIRFGHDEDALLPHAPELGENNFEVLNKILGLGRDDVAELTYSGVLGSFELKRDH